MLKRLGKPFAYLLVFILLGGLAAWMWFWGRPVGVTNYVNRETVRLATQSPEALSFAGLDGTPIDRHSHRLGDTTRAEADRLLALGREARAGLERYHPDGRLGRFMSEEERTSYAVASSLADDILASAERDWSGYPVTQLTGPQVNMPSFLTDRHTITGERSARNYVSRLREFGRVLGETRDNVEEAREGGVVAPDFILRATLTGMESFVANDGEGGADENILVTDFARRLSELGQLDDDGKTKGDDLSAETEAELVMEARAAVAEHVLPGYRALIDQHEALLETADSDAGIWRIPDGEAIYAEAVRSNTTTDYSPDELHRIGLSEVERIAGEMDAILRAEGLMDGPVGERVQTLMRDPAHHFPNTDEGREELLDYLRELNDDIMARAATAFATLPDAELEIERVPAFAQDGAPGGYYQPPPPFGQGAGTFYINLKDTADNPKWTLPTLLVHEAAPGHHFQITRGMELSGVPLLRKFSPYTAYTEGWALYVEHMMADDLGLYDDAPLSKLGQLQAEMFRAVRLVVDTGLHAKRWDRERAIDYMIANTGMSEAEVTREIERYVVWPGQALAYKTGQLAMLDMRARAEKAFGKDFDLRAFHEKVLESGALPLDMLDAKINAWIAEEA